MLEIKPAAKNKTPKEATSLHPPIPVFVLARVLFYLLSLSLSRPKIQNETERFQSQRVN